MNKEADQLRKELQQLEADILLISQLSCMLQHQTTRREVRFTQETLQGIRARLDKALAWAEIHEGGEE